MAETVATYTVPEHHILQFTGNVQAALAKQGGTLRSHVTVGSYVGERSQVVNFLGTIEFIERDTPYQDTNVSEIEHTQRWVSGRDFDCATLIDRIDQLKMIYDPSSPYVERMREAAARKEDEIIVAKFFATAKTGKQGESTTSFPSQDVIAHGATGMTVAKLRSARKLLKKRFVDLKREMPKIGFTSEEADDLLGEVAVGSSDYNAVKPLVDGEVSKFMGFEFIPLEGFIEAVSTTYNRCPVWVPSGMHYGDWQNLAITIGPRPDKNNVKQIHGCFTGDATRLQEGKVLELQCGPLA
jgi:hypothetical protein